MKRTNRLAPDSASLPEASVRPWSLNWSVSGRASPEAMSTARGSWARVRLELSVSASALLWESHLQPIFQSSQNFSPLPIPVPQDDTSNNLSLEWKTVWTWLLVSVTVSHTAKSISVHCLLASLQDLIHILIHSHFRHPPKFGHCSQSPLPLCRIEF